MNGMQWNQMEIDLAAVVASDIEACAIARTTAVSKDSITLTPAAAARLKIGMSANALALPIRHLFQKMGFDEKRIFRWRPEHKLVQALLLRHYCGDCIPVTRGLWRELSTVDPKGYPRVLEELHADGYLVKPALGYASGEREQVDRFTELLEQIKDGSGAPHVFVESKSLVAGECANDSSVPTVTHALGLLAREQFIIQRRLDIAEEYRVHTLEDAVIPTLTFRRYFNGSSLDTDEVDAVNGYVRNLVAGLPDALVRGTLYGWDVARTCRGEFRVLEVNPSGFHPAHEPGFHCSGFFLGEKFGAVTIAKLISHIEERYGLTISIQPPPVEEDNAESKAYSDVKKWRDLLNIAREFFSPGQATTG